MAAQCHPPLTLASALGRRVRSTLWKAADARALRTPAGRDWSCPCQAPVGGSAACWIGLVLALAATSFVFELRQQDIADSERERKNLALILADETDRSSPQAVELVQLGLIEHVHELGIDSPEKFERQLGSFNVHQDLRARIAGLSRISQPCH